MRLIGFDFTKISAEKSDKLNEKYVTNTNMDITDIKEEDLRLVENQKVIKIAFKFEVIYNSKDNKDKKFGELNFEGDLVFSAGEKEVKELLDNWKKKEKQAISPEFKVPLFNMIMRKCTPKALDLEDALGLPFHFPFPQIKAAPAAQSDNEEDKKE